MSSIQDTYSCALHYISDDYPNINYVNLTLHPLSNTRLFTVLTSIITRRIDYSNKPLWPPNRFEPIVWATTYCFHCIAIQRKKPQKNQQQPNTHKKQNDKPTAVELVYVPVSLVSDLPVYFLFTAYLSRWCRNRTHDFTHLLLTKFIWIYISILKLLLKYLCVLVAN